MWVFAERVTYTKPNDIKTTIQWFVYSVHVHYDSYIRIRAELCTLSLTLTTI